MSKCEMVGSPYLVHRRLSLLLLDTGVSLWVLEMELHHKNSVHTTSPRLS